MFEHLSRQRKLELYAQVAATVRQQREPTEQLISEAHFWALSYANKPIEFIGEVMGPEWWTDDWLAWRAFVRAAWGQTFTSQTEEEIYRECTGRTLFPSARFREVWSPIGRRGGKSRTFAYVAVHIGCCYDWSPYLVPGERGMIPVLAETKDRAQQTMGYIKAALDHPKLAALVVRELAEEIELVGNVAIRVMTASIRAVRSRAIISAVCDECAFWPTDESANPDRQIINSMRPAMLTIPGSMLFALSSPYGRRGMLYERYREFYGKNDPRVLVWQAPTLRMHPSADRDEIAHDYEEDPESAAAEYGAEFRTDVAAYVTREAIEAVVISGRYELLPQSGVEYRAFVDPSGGQHDSFTLAITHRDSKGVGVLDLLRETRPPFSPDTVTAAYADDCHRYGVAQVTGDHYAGDWVSERFGLHGISYIVSDDAKSQIYQAWLPLINSNRVELLDDARLITQACALERRTTRLGRDAIDHPPNAFDDVVNVAAGALVLVLGQRYKALWTVDAMPVVG